MQTNTHAEQPPKTIRTVPLEAPAELEAAQAHTYSSAAVLLSAGTHPTPHADHSLHLPDAAPADAAPTPTSHLFLHRSPLLILPRRRPDHIPDPGVTPGLSGQLPVLPDRHQPVRGVSVALLPKGQRRLSAQPRIRCKSGLTQLESSPN